MASATLLRACHAMSGTDVAYAATREAGAAVVEVLSRGSTRPYRTGIACGTTCMLRDVRYWHILSAYALAMRCPVLTQALLLLSSCPLGATACERASIDEVRVAAYAMPVPDTA
eukprot:624430-Rhodomonas_salina.2